MSGPSASPPLTPTTPARAARSVSSTSTSNHTTRSLALEIFPGQTPSNPVLAPSAADPPLAYQLVKTPTIPTTPALGSRQSSASIRRKPVPLELDDLDPPSLQLTTPRLSTSSSTSTTPSNPSSFRRTPGAPPIYVLPVDPPAYPVDSSSVSNTLRHDALALGIDTGLSQSRTAVEDLPRYTEERETEPQTLARSLWKWGWLCPLLWAIGMCIVWIPLRPVEEEADAEKAQKLEEMIVILRDTELKYAKRCLWSFLGFLILIMLIVGLGIGLSRVL